MSDDARRIRVGVLLGGASAEREISLASGRMIADHLPRDRYEVVLFDSLALMAGNPALSADLTQKAQALLAQAQASYQQAQTDLKAGNLGAYQNDINALESALQAVQAITGGPVASTTTTTTTNPGSAAAAALSN